MRSEGVLGGYVHWSVLRLLQFEHGSSLSQRTLRFEHGRQAWLCVIFDVLDSYAVMYLMWCRVDSEARCSACASCAMT
jgi:hypothetical protein